MSEALVGLLGVLAGLAIGSGYTFWAARRSELSAAVVAAATLAEELRVFASSRDTDPESPRFADHEGSPGSAPDMARLDETWRGQREALVIFMSPGDYRNLADSVPTRSDVDGPFGLRDLIGRFESLGELLWAEHQAFILVPLAHYVTGNTVSKRIRRLLDPSVSPEAGAGSDRAAR